MIRSILLDWRKKTDQIQLWNKRKSPVRATNVNHVVKTQKSTLQKYKPNAQKHHK